MTRMLRQLGRCALAASAVVTFAAPVYAQSAFCSATSVGRIPLTDLGTNAYHGFMGGLYPNGMNTPPGSHAAAGIAIADEILPRNGFGEVDEANGSVIGFVSIGMSYTNQEFEVFEYEANVDVLRNPRVTTVNGAQGGQTAFQWADPEHVAWTELDRIVALEGLSNAQVQVAWVKLTVRGSDVGGWESHAAFPATAQVLQEKLRAVVRNLKDKYPNVKIAYLSSRVYGHYASGLEYGSQYPEPVAYEEGFAVKWLIEEQINGDPTLSYTGANPVAPYLTWGPYLWADGLGSDGVSGGIPGRLDGLEYSCEDFLDDGHHPSASGRQKVADQLLQFLHTDPTSRRWYINPNPPPVGGTPYYVDLDGIDDYLEIADAATLTFADGSGDTPLTFEFWFRADSMAGKQNLISKWLDGSNQEYRLYLSSGTIRLDLRDSSAQATASVYTAGQSSLAGNWHHLAVTYDGRGGPTATNGIALYVDGVAMPLTRLDNTRYVSMRNSPVSLQIGRESSRFKQYNGALDEVRIWNVALSQGAIQAQMSAELAGTQPNLIGYWRLNEGIGAMVADDSPTNLPAFMYNDPIWSSGGPMAPPDPDTTPPEISSTVTSNLTPSSVTIRFHTSEATTGWVSYTQGTSCPCTDVFSPSVGTDHTIVLTSLTPDSLYFYEVKATDRAGNFRLGPQLSFVTPSTPPDLTPPTVSITSPRAGNVAGSILLEANAQDNVGVSGVRFAVDGVYLGAEDLTPPYSISWDTSTVADGPHTITAEARDAANNVEDAAVLINVWNNATGTPYFLELDGVDDYLSIPDSDTFSFTNGAGDTPLTFELWFRPDSMAGKQNLISKWLDGPAQEYRLYITSGTLRLDLRDSVTQATVSAYTANQSALLGGWHHLAVTYDGRGGATAANGVAIYVDGAAVPMTRFSNAAYVSMRNSTMPLQIGRESTRFKQYDGGLDEIRIWNIALVETVIQSRRSTELTGAEPGLAGYWMLNEGSGATATDGSPSSHPASIFNDPSWISGGPLALPLP